MKKQLFILSAMLMAPSIYAQSYTFKSDVVAYEEITDRSKEDSVLNDYFEFQSPMVLTVFGKKVAGTFTAGTGSGYLVMSNTSFSYALDPMLGAWFRKISSKSRVNIATVISGNDTQLVVQWKDMGFYGHPDNHVVNCQVRISKTTGIITYHYGKSNYARIANDSAFSDPQNTGPEVLLVKLTTDFSGVLEFNTVAGSPQAPYFTSQFERMTGLPIENQRFIFSPKAPVSVAHVDAENRLTLVYPNPAIGQSLFINAPEAVTGIVAKNLLGQTLNIQVSGLDTKQAEVTLGQTVQPLWLEITLANGETIVRKITIGN